MPLAMSNNVNNSLLSVFDKISTNANHFNDAQKVSIDESGNVKAFNDSRSLFGKNIVINQKSQITLNNLYEALVTRHESLGEEAFRAFISKRKIDGKQRITFGDLKNISNYINNAIQNAARNTQAQNIANANTNNNVERRGIDVTIDTNQFNLLKNEQNQIKQKLFNNTNIKNKEFSAAHNDDERKALIKNKAKETISKLASNNFGKNVKESKVLHSNIDAINKELRKYEGLKDNNNIILERLNSILDMKKSLISSFKQLKDDNNKPESKASMKDYIEKAKNFVLSANMYTEGFHYTNGSLSSTDLDRAEHLNTLVGKAFGSINDLEKIVIDNELTSVGLDECKKNLESYKNLYYQLLDRKADSYKNFMESYKSKFEACKIAFMESLDAQNKYLANHKGINEDKSNQEKVNSFNIKMSNLYNSLLLKYELKAEDANNSTNNSVPKKYLEKFKSMGDKFVKESNKLIADTFGEEYALSKNLVKDKYNELLSKNEWKPISSKMTVKLATENKGTRETTVTSHIIPVAHLKNVTVKNSYEKGVNGYPSGNRITGHLPNLAKSTLVNEKNEELFSGYRHAVLDAFGEKNKATRTAKNHNRAQELITCIVQDKYLENLKNSDKAYTRDKPFEFEMVSVSMLNPIFDEGKYTRKQNEALINGNQPFEISIPLDDGTTKTVFVKPKVSRFVFSVNKANRYLGRITASYGDELNNIEGRGILLNEDRLDNFMNNSDISNLKKTKVRILHEEIKRIIHNKDHINCCKDIYALPARIALLNNIMGGVTCYNCKSGKDRTGQLDVAIKALAVKLSELDGKEIKNFNETKDITEKFLKNRSSIFNEKNLTTEDRSNLTDIAIQGGNMELQKYNTGVAGSKIYDPSGVTNQFSSSEMFEFYQGASGYAKS